ncbi:MAG: polymer-forming cytoskeletal protein [Proteobacteria bacterium]|nr:polymer-forming cytoskeletal protein [Pseudomonadota bacterium]
MKKISEDFSIIDKELTIDGTVSTTGRLIVKGILKGTIIGNNVVIAEEGSVYANAKVASMTIGGTFEGEIRALKKLILLSTGKCTGKVVCKDLVIETGGILNAQVTCLSGENAGMDIQHKETIV